MAQAFGPDDLIACYRRGVFPMSDSREDESFYLVEPKLRGILPLEALHVSKSMHKFRRQTSYIVTINQDFPAVIEACATSHDGTWISHGIEGLYLHLHMAGQAHSVEVWGISMAPRDFKWSVKNCVSRRMKPRAFKCSTKWIRASFEALVRRENMLSPKKACPCVTP